MTYDELHALTLEFMVENYGRPITLEPEERDRWHETLGVLTHFANTLFNRVCTNSNSPNDGAR